MRLLRKKILRYLGVKLLPYVASLLIRFLSLTNKKVFHGPENFEGKKFIMVLWHGELLMIPHAYLHYRKTPNVDIVVSEHFDGELIAKTLQQFGFRTIRGSSTRGGAKVLIEAIKALKNGCDVGITPDGPRGPIYTVHDGVIAMAQKSKVGVVLVRAIPTKYWQLNSWDKFVIPKPFGIINYYVSDVLDISSMEKEEARIFVKEGMQNYER